MNTITNSFVLLVFITCSLGSVSRFVLLADLHLDLGYDENFGAETTCRPEREDGHCKTTLGPMQKRLESDSNRSFEVGRYGCDSPQLLLKSL